MPGAVIGSPAAARSSFAPSAASIASAGMPPGRSSRGVFAGKRDDGRFQPDRAGSGVEHQRDGVAELVDDMLGARRAEPAGAVGARRGERAAEGRDDGLRAGRAGRGARSWQPGGDERMHRRAGRERHDEA